MGSDTSNTWLSQLPDGFVPYKQWDDFGLLSQYPKLLSPKVTGTNPRGLRRGIWPLIIEEYVSDTEPQLTPDPTAPNRIIIWQRLTNTTKPKGWIQFSKGRNEREGFIALNQNQDYWRNWSRKAKEERNQWLALCLEGIYTVEAISWKELELLYRKSTVSKTFGLICMQILKRKYLAGNTSIRLWGVRETKTGTLVAGMGVIYSQENSAAYYELGCKLNRIHDPVMVGLFDHWHKTATTDGLVFLHLGVFWIPGKPRSWKGFSFFKSKFKPQYIDYQPALYKFTKGKLW